MAVENYVGGKPVAVLGSDGTDLYCLLVDAAGRLQVDLVNLDDIGDIATETTLASLLTELEAKLETADLSIGAVTKWLEVIVMSSALPTGATTETTLALVKDRLGALTTPAAGSTNKLLTDALTALQIIDGFANADNVVHGYNAVLADHQHTANASAGTNVLSTATVPAGEVWVVEQITCRDLNSAPSRLEWNFYDGSSSLMFKALTSLSANITVEWTGSLHLSEGMRIDAAFFGCTLNDDLYLETMGYKMKV